MGKLLYTLKDYSFTSMTIIVSNDGMRLTVIDDNMEGNIMGHRPALQFFYKGKLLKSYETPALVKDTFNVAYSVWHISWCLGDFGLKNRDSTFQLATFEFNEMEFNTFTGVLVKNKKPAAFDDNTWIVVGKLRKGDSPQTQMKVWSYIAGKKMPNDQINFATHHFGPGELIESLMIKDGVDVTPARFVGVMFPNGWKHK
jgi:hypothetical protein